MLSPEEQRRQEKFIHTVFVWGVILKGLNAILEIVGGVAFLFGDKLTAWAQNLLNQEFLEDPHDMVATYLQKGLNALTSGSAETFLSFYLLSHGIIKLFLAAALLRSKYWAYPVAIVVFFLFVAYQVYRYSFTHSAYLILLTLFDLLLIWLTWHEYKYYKKHHALPK